MKLTYILKVCKRMFSIESGIDNISNLSTKPHKRIWVHYRL